MEPFIMLSFLKFVSLLELLVGLYLNIPHEEVLSELRKRLDNRMEKYISSDTLCNLSELVLKTIF